MTAAAKFASLGQLVRYYQTGIVNTIFGLSLYALLVRLGLNRYAAQLVAHCIGVAFNYFTYSRYAFRDTQSSKLRFFMSYVVNYFIGLALLFACSTIIPSPYLAMGVATVIATAINYLILRRFVFLQPAPAP